MYPAIEIKCHHKVTDPYVFFPFDLWRMRFGHKSMGKNSVSNLQHGPRTQLVRGMCELGLIESYKIHG